MKLKLHLQKVKENLDTMKVYAVYFETTFYLGQVQKIFYYSEDETSDNISEVEMKYLKWCGDDKFKWPVKDEVELVKLIFIFDGPIQTDSFDPFVVRTIQEIRELYKNISKLMNELFPAVKTSIN